MVGGAILENDRDRGRSSAGKTETRTADVAAWLAVVAGTLGALMATLDISIVNSALPTIQGEIGASGTEGTWVATSYLVAEIIVIPMSAWFQRLFGLRTFLLIAVISFTAFSILCGVSTTLAMIIIGRVGQGFTGGALIPTAQTIIAQRLPQSKQPIGIALFGVTVIFGPVLGPLIGGWLTENLSWHYAFFINLPLGAILVPLLIFGLPSERLRLSLIGEADWLGIVGLVLGLGGLTVFLEEAQREQWFDSQLIRTMVFVFLLGFALLFLGQFTAKQPIIKLRLLRDRQFGAVVLMAMVMGMVLYGTVYALPQFLVVVAGYNTVQSGYIVLLSGIPSLFMLAIVPILFRVVDIRVAVAAGLAIIGSAALIDAHLSIMSSGETFAPTQLIRGVGHILGMLFLSQAAVRAVGRDDAGDAAGLFNAARNLGGSLALAGIGIIQDQRHWLHSRRLEDSLHANSPRVQEYVSGLAAASPGSESGIRLLEQQIQMQALVMTYNDIFFIMGLGALAALPLVFFLRPLPKNASLGAMH